MLFCRFLQVELQFNEKEILLVLPKPYDVPTSSFVGKFFFVQRRGNVLNCDEIEETKQEPV